MGLLPPDFYDNTLSSNVVSKTKEVPLLQDYLIDLDTGYLIVSDSGQFTIVTGLRAVVMQMWRKLHTVRGEFSIYDSKYGNTLNELIGKGKSYADVYAFQKVSDAIIDKIYVLSINNFSTELSKDKYIINFTANTIYGDTSSTIGIPLED